MNITLNEDLIQETLNNVAAKCVESGLESYDVKKSVTSAITKAVAESALSTAVAEAVSKADFTAIAESVSRELVKTVASVTVRAMREAAVTTIIGLRKQPYITDKELAEQRAQIMATLDR